jgi:hypothetical protein
MCPDGYLLRRFRGSRRSSWACLGLVAAAACSPAGNHAAADAPVSVTPVAADPPPLVAEPVAVPPPASSADSVAAAGEFIDPDEMPVVPSAPVRRRGLLAKQVSCPGGGTTSVSGTVYIPSGELALYNAMVYVPDADLRPFTPGASCGCEITGEPIASALTDPSGHFVLENVPVGSDIPIVVQVGEWRREFKLDSVAACVDTPIADQTLRLPSKQSEGDIPRIAVATGFADAVECLVRKLGIAPEEFTHPTKSGRVNLYAGYGGAERFATSLNAGDTFPPAAALWSDLPSLQMYDIVLLSCEGPPEGGATRGKDARAMQAMADYLNGGGRLFASHYQEIWFQQGPAPFPDLATYDDDTNFDTDLTAQVVTSFPKGKAMADWALANGASAGQGQVEIAGAQRTILQENPAYAQRWLASDERATVQYLSANTPLGAGEADQCGRLVLSDLHVSPGRLPGEVDAIGDDYSQPSTGFPDGCVTSTLSAQEKLLAFMLFDISACVVPDDQAPTAAPIIR